MLLKHQFPIENEPKIIPCIFGIKNKASQSTEIQGQRIEQFMYPRKIKNFRFPMFNDQTKIFKKR